jgi:hypothetical protein
MTPDELPAIEGRVEAFIRWTDPCNTKPFSGSSLQLVSDLRALLKAYQEQRRALEAASPVVPVGSADTLERQAAEIKRLRGALGNATAAMASISGLAQLATKAAIEDLQARAALTGEDAATLGFSGKTHTDARTRGDG